MTGTTDRPTSLRQSPTRSRGNEPEPTFPKSPGKKLSYKEQREYDALEAKIAEAEAKASTLEARVADPKIAADHARMAQACRELETAQAEVARLYARWEELEAKRG